MREICCSIIVVLSCLICLEAQPTCLSNSQEIRNQVSVKDKSGRFVSNAKFEIVKYLGYDKTESLKIAPVIVQNETYYFVFGQNEIEDRENWLTAKKFFSIRIYADGFEPYLENLNFVACRFQFYEVTLRQSGDLTTTISGLVLDQSGARIPGAEIVILDGTGKSFVVWTNGDGIYELDLAAGKYQITFKAPGFIGFSVKDFNVATKYIHAQKMDIVLSVESSGPIEFPENDICL